MIGSTQDGDVFLSEIKDQLWQIQHISSVGIYLHKETRKQRELLLAGVWERKKGISLDKDTRSQRELLLVGGIGK